MIKAELITGDFQEKTVTFKIENDMNLTQGKYVILSEEQYKELKFGGNTGLNPQGPSDILE